MGCIGADKSNKDGFGEKLENAMTAAGVETSYKLTATKPTGTCAVCINDKNRLGVSNVYKT